MTYPVTDKMNKVYVLNEYCLKIMNEVLYLPVGVTESLSLLQRSWLFPFKPFLIFCKYTHQKAQQIQQPASPLLNQGQLCFLPALPHCLAFPVVRQQKRNADPETGSPGSNDEDQFTNILPLCLPVAQVTTCLSLFFPILLSHIHVHMLPYVHPMERSATDLPLSDPPWPRT